MTNNLKQLLKEKTRFCNFSSKHFRQSLSPTGKYFVCSEATSCFRTVFVLSSTLSIYAAIDGLVSVLADAHDELKIAVLFIFSHIQVNMHSRAWQSLITQKLVILLNFYYYYNSAHFCYNRHHNTRLRSIEKQKGYSVVGKFSTIGTGSNAGPVKNRFRWNKGTSYVSETVGFSFTIPYSVPGMPDQPERIMRLLNMKQARVRSQHHQNIFLLSGIRWLEGTRRDKFVLTCNS